MSDPAEEATLKWIESLKEFKGTVQDGDYANAAKAAVGLLVSVPASVNDSIKTVLYETYCKCLLHEKEYQKVIGICEKHAATDPERFQPIRLYALYRLQRYEEAREQTSKAITDGDTDADSALQHIHAQSLFHLAQTNKAIQQYQALLEQCTDDEQRMEVFTNLTATLAANATPYVRSASNLDVDIDDICDQAHTFLNSTATDKKDDYPYDLAYNLATYELTTSATQLHKWTDLLTQAQEACRQQNEDESLASQQRDLAPITTNLQWSRDFWTGSSTDSAKKLDSQPVSVQTVRTLNHAFGVVSTSSSPAEGIKALQAQSDVTLTPLQKRIFRYNQAVLQFRNGNWSDCRHSCQTLLGSLQQLSNTQKKKQKQNGLTAAGTAGSVHQPVASQEDAVWWESRVAVLQALCCKQQGKLPQAKEDLQGVLEKLRSMDASAVRDHALAYVQLEAATISETASTADETVELLQELPESIRSRKAVVASLASIYHQQGKVVQAEDLLRATGDDQALAEFAMSQGNYVDAAALYEKAAAAADSQDVVSTARWVHALSFVDADRAQKLWSEASPELVDDGGVNGAELEERELPRFKTTKARKTDVLAVDNEPTDSSKSHDAVLRRRGRQREQFLSVLQDKGLYRVDRPTKPDPERWLPKYERSYARRRRNRGGPHKGAQGGVSEKDAAKLDVAARQAARASGQPDSSGPSTAHMVVTAAGGARKAKGGKKR